jgi:hypothetical protein
MSDSFREKNETIKMAITIIPCREEEMRVVSPPGSFLSDSLF